MQQLAVMDFDKQQGYSFGEAFGDIKETGSEIASGWKTAGDRIVDRAQQYNLDESTGMNFTRNFVGAGAELFRGIGNTIGSVFKGGAKLASTQSFEDTASEKIQDVGKWVMEQPQTQQVVEKYQSLAPEQRQAVDDILGYMNGLTAMVSAREAVDITKNTLVGAKNMAVSGTKAVGGYADDAARAAGGYVDDAARLANTSPTVKGTIQRGKEILVDRPMRTARNVADDIQDAAVRADRLQTATPAVRQAITSNLDDRVINTVSQSDDVTLRAMKEMVDIADNPSPTLKQGVRPEIVAGKAAEAQYRVIEEQRKAIGKQIGSAVDDLSKKGAIDVLPQQTQMRNILSSNGIKVDSSGTLQFTGKFTPPQRAAIQQLYDLAIEGGDSLSPRQIYDMDQLFSKLQREARFEKISDIIVSTPDGDENLYRVFRDIYSTKLDEISPEIRSLNRQYRPYRQLQDDIENSIVKQGNYNVTADPAQFAQTNLRRIMSDAQSAAAYREILKQMDDVARANGYTGARPDDLIEFATYLREVYPTTVPRTSLPGSIVTGNKASGLLQKAIDMGEPTTKEQQKALRALIDEALDAMDAQKGTTVPVEATKAAAQASKPTAAQGIEERQVVSSSNTNTVKSDAEMMRRLTRERGGVGEPSTEWLLQKASNEMGKNTTKIGTLAKKLEKSPNSTAVKGEIARLQSDNEYLNDYIRRLQKKLA